MTVTEQHPLPLAVTMGDPAGCGPQITGKAWETLRNESGGTPFYVLADPALFSCDTHVIGRPEETTSVFPEALPVLPLTGKMPALQTGMPNSAAAPGILESIDRATRHALDGCAAGVVTNPISKSVLYSAGFRHPGHTEYLAAICENVTGEPCPPVMMLAGGGLRVSLTTIHIPLMSVPLHLTPENLAAVVRTTNKALKRDFAIQHPRIAFTGLNPHAGESGTIGTEERDIINPLAAQLREEGLDITDARPGDTVFAEMLDGRFDAIIAMTHDQGLIPVKTLDFWGGVNTTLGLPIIRTSPDHGTAYDAARDGKARPDSLISAIKLASEMATNRLAHV